MPPPCRDIGIPYRAFYRIHYTETADFPFPRPNVQSDKAYFRGGTTGGPYRPGAWRLVPRAMVVLKCQERPDLCDAQLVGYTDYVDPTVREEMKRELGTHPYEPFGTIFEYK